jgi:hypothetical protein
MRITSPSPLAFLLAAALAVATSAAAAAVPNGGRPSLAARVSASIGMPSGDHAYLRALEKALAVIHPLLWHTKRAQEIQILGRNQAFQQELSSIVRAFGRGANSQTVRDRLLQCLTLGGGYLRWKGHRWRLGGLWDRVALCSYMRYLARHASPGRSAAYGRAALILWVQNGIQLGGGACMGVWLNPKVFPTASANLRALSLTRSQIRHLTAIFRRSVARTLAFESRTNPPSRFAGALEAAGRKPVPPRLLASFLSSLGRSLSLAKRRVGMAYATLRVASAVRTRLIVNGHLHGAEKLRAALLAWARRLAASGGSVGLARGAVLRWIREAMGP